MVFTAGSEIEDIMMTMAGSTLCGLAIFTVARRSSS
jgi:hypothetical protein